MTKKNYFNPFFLVAIFLVSACVPMEQIVLIEEEALQFQESVISWEEFKEESTRYYEGEEFYIVEWDLPIKSEEALRSYYEKNILLAKQPELAFLIVSRVDDDTQDDLWTVEESLNLSYCVSDEFGADQARAINEMAQAVADWEAVVSVNFIYAPSQNANCNNTNDNIVFSVRPWDQGGACAFSPIGGTDADCLDRTLLIDFEDFDNSQFYAIKAPNLTTTGVFRHELGHILGLLHEHIRIDGLVPLGCASGEDYRELTEYDVNSVMHYPWCKGVLEADFEISPLDIDGIFQLYGDSDWDGIPDRGDNCPFNQNPQQSNHDHDEQGDLCDPDDDNDGMSDSDEFLSGRNPLVNEPAVLQIFKSLLLN